jgi:hypothetical protein
MIWWSAGTEKHLTSYRIDAMEGWTAWRFNLKLTMGMAERQIDYRLEYDGPEDAERYQLPKETAHPARTRRQDQRQTKGGRTREGGFNYLGRPWQE